MLKKVLHIAKSPCAGAPGNVNRCINAYGKYESSVFCKNPVIRIASFLSDYHPENLTMPELQKAIDSSDVVHFHNCTHDDFPNNQFINRPLIYQLHSEPAVKAGILQRYRHHCITIAQKHATLYKYKIYTVPNIIDILEERYTPAEKNNSKPVIFYAASSVTTRSDYTDTCAGKGYAETNEILDRIQYKFRDKIRIVRYTKTDKHIVLEDKRHADIVIDECVTGGYHLTSLEGLSQGCIVINNLNEDVEKVFRDISKYQDGPIPFERAGIHSLYSTLEYLINQWYSNRNEFRIKQEQNRQWMIDNWHPGKMISYYENLYDYKLGITPDPYDGLKYSGNLDRVRTDRDKTKSIYQPDNAAITNLEEFKSNLRIKKDAALILGMGPSINKINNLDDYLLDCAVFSCNYYYLKFDHGFIDYWCCIDSGAFKEAVNNISKLVPVIGNYPVSHVDFNNPRIWLSDHLDTLNKYFTSGIEIERPFTVANIMLMMAIYLEYNPIYIAGVDLSLDKGKENYCYSKGEKTKYHNNKFRAFTKNYRWIIQQFKKLKREAEIRGIQIYNLNKNPIYDVFDIR